MLQLLDWDVKLVVAIRVKIETLFNKSCVLSASEARCIHDNVLIAPSRTKSLPTFLLKEGCAAPKGCATVDKGSAGMDTIPPSKQQQTGRVGGLFVVVSKVSICFRRVCLCSKYLKKKELRVDILI